MRSVQRAVRSRRRGALRELIVGLLSTLCLLPLAALAQPALSIADVALDEGNAGTTTFTFRVSLDAPAPAGGVRFDIATLDGSADAGDYAAIATSEVVIAEGDTGYDLPVTVYTDEDHESDETFFVDVTNVVGATVADARATGTIRNDETEPQILIEDALVVEGDAGTVVLDVPVRLSYPGSREIRVDYATVDVSAFAGDDYEAASGTLVFAPGETVRSVPITIRGDTDSERTEIFGIELSNAVGTSGGGSGSAHVSIVTDDNADDPILPATLPDAALGDRYDQQIYMGRTRASFAITSGALPPGIALTPFNGATYLLGIPTATGTYAFAVTAYEFGQPIGYRAYTLTVGGPTLALPPTTLPDADYQGNYAAVLNPATGGQTPYRYAITGGALPPGLQLQETGLQAGTISGIAQRSGSFTFTVTVSDSSPAGPYTATREYTLRVLPPVLQVEAIDPLSGAEGESFEARFAVIGGTNEPFRFAVTAGRLPAGLQMNDNGVIAGVALESGDFPITVTVTDGTTDVPGSGSAAFTLQIEPAALRLAPSALSRAVVGTFYSQTFAVSGGQGPFEFELFGGALPPGITLQTDGRLVGTPETPGRYDFTVLVRDLASVSGLAEGWSFVLEVADTGLQFPTAQLAPASAGVPYQATLSAQGGTGPYRYAVVEGALPPGIALSEDGVLSGSPQAAGTFHFQVRAIDANGAMVVANPLHTLVVALPGLRLAPARPLPAQVGRDYRLQLQAEGGQAPYRYAVVAGALPAGLQLSEDGVIAGVPQGVGSHALTIAATDASAPYGPLRGELAYTLVVEAASDLPAPTDVPSDAPIAASRTLAPWAGAQVLVDLEAEARGGPFIDAEVVSLSPAAAGTAAIERGGDRLRLRFVPTPDWVGQVEIRYTLRSAQGVSAPATLLFALRARPDPAAEARVRRALDLQLRSARRFADAQIANVRDRLERIRAFDGAVGGRIGGFDNALRMLAARPCAPTVGALPGRPCAFAPQYDEDASDGLSPDPRGGSAAAFGLWAGGTVRPANHDGRNGGDRLGFETDGLSFGADFRPDPRSVLGFGVGYARDGGALAADDDGRSRSEALGLTVYGSLRLRERGFVDALIGQQRLGFDLRRGDASTDGAWHGRRAGAQWFAAVSAGAEFGRGGWQVVPYARWEVGRLRLDGFVESASAASTPAWAELAPPALAYAAFDARRNSLDLGLRIEHRRETAWGSLAPRFRAEYRHDLDGAGVQRLRYADLPDDRAHRATLDGFARRRLELSAGLRLAFARGWSLDLDWRAPFGDADSARDRSVQLGVQARF